MVSSSLSLYQSFLLNGKKIAKKDLKDRTCKKSPKKSATEAQYQKRDKLFGICLQLPICVKAKY